MKKKGRLEMGAFQVIQSEILTLHQEIAAAAAAVDGGGGVVDGNVVKGGDWEAGWWQPLQLGLQKSCPNNHPHHHPYHGHH